MRVGYPLTERRAAAAVGDVGSKAGQKYGVDLQNIYISGGARLTRRWSPATSTMATTGGAVINAVLSGAELVYIALIVPTYGFSVYARSGLERYLQLERQSGRRDDKGSVRQITA